MGTTRQALLNFFLVLTGATLLHGCSYETTNRKAAVDRSVYLEVAKEETAARLNACIDPELAHDPFLAECFLLIEDSAHREEGSKRKTRSIECKRLDDLQRSMPTLERSTFEDFLLREARALANEDLETRKAIQSMLGQPNIDCAPEQSSPGSPIQTRYTFSVIGYSKNKAQALLHVLSRGPAGLEGAYVLLDLKVGHWQISQRVIAWVS